MRGKTAKLMRDWAKVKNTDVKRCKELWKSLTIAEKKVIAEYVAKKLASDTL